MARKTTHTNYRVVVEPKSGWHSSDESRNEACRQACGEMIEQIRRHVDGVHSATVECDTEHTCEHCGYGWETESDGEPLCCEKAVAEFNAAKGA